MILLEKILNEISLLEHLELFVENDIDDEILSELSTDDLKEIGITSLGQRKKIIAAIAKHLNWMESPTEQGNKITLSSDQEPRDQRREVTVLFADLTNYTKLTQQLAVEDVHEVLSDLYKAFDGIVRRVGGTVDRHIGDCVMAIFGAPISYGNDVERALRCSIEMHEAMQVISKKHGYELSVHVGIAAGRVLYSRKGQGELIESDFTVTGDSINLASRLANKAEATQTLISEQIYQSLRDRVLCEKLDEVEAKGFEDPITTYRFNGFRTHSIERKFVGRVAEIGMAELALSQCSDRKNGQVLYVRGQAGLGKTALLDQILELAKSRSMDCHRVLLLDFGLGDDNTAVKVITSELSGISVGATEYAIGNAAHGYCDVGILDDQGTYFFEFVMGLKPEGAAKTFLESLDDISHTSGRHDMICSIAKAEALKNPLLIAIEDMHWADAETLMLVSKLAALTRELPILLVMTSRVEGDQLDQTWKQGIEGARFSQIDLAPLSFDEAMEFARHLQAPNAQMIEKCLEKAEGNPLFLEQLLRHSNEAGGDFVPGSIQSLVQSRVDLLSPDDRRVLNAAAVLGQRFKLDAATSIASIKVFDERALIEASLIRPFRSELLFSHALIRDGVYQTILRDELRQLHLNAASWFEHYDKLLFAEHLEKAHSDKASLAYLAASRDAASERRLENSLSLIERGRAVDYDKQNEVEYLLLEGDVLRDLGRGTDSSKAFESAISIAQLAEDKIAAQIGLIATMRIQDRLVEAADVIASAEELALGSDHFEFLSKLNYLKGSLCFPKGDFKGCLKAHTKALDFAKQADLPELTARALSGLGDAYYAQGRMFRAHSVFEECLDLCGEHGLGAVESANRFMLGTVKIYMNETQNALEQASQSAELAQKIGQLRPEIVSRLTAAWILQSMAHHDEAQVEIDRGMNAANELGAKRFEPFLQETSIRVLLSKGLNDEATFLADKVLEQTRELGAMNFIGPWVLATTAMTKKNQTERQVLLDEGSQLLAKGCVGHNYFRFHLYGMLGCADAEEWDQVRKHCDALDQYTQSEPTPWSVFYIKLGNAMADFGEQKSAARESLILLSTEASKASLFATKNRIDKLL